MPEPNPSKPTPSSSGAKELLGLGLTAKAPWQPGELKVLLQDELASPLEFELGALPTSEARQVVLRAKAQGLLVRSLGELLRHPKPPLELLVLAKDYFKRNESHPDSELPPDLALGLYYACIAVALWRHKRRITQLSRDELTEAFRWLEAQSWMDDYSRRAASEASKLL